MLEKVKEFKEGFNGVMDFCMKQIDGNILLNMDTETFEVYKKTMKLLNLSLDIMTEQAEIIDEQNKKLDKILELVEKLEAQ